MILAVDIGNTRIKWACLHQGAWSKSESVPHAGRFIPTSLAQAWATLASPTRVVICSVASPGNNEAMCAWVQGHWAIDPEYVVAQAQGYGVTNGYTRHETLGPDRWAAMIAARQLMAGPVCVIDCGTAVTLDLITAAGVHLGGMIVPGWRAMQRSLHEETARIPEQMVHDVDIEMLGQSTGTAVANGTRYAIASLIDRTMADLSAQLDTKVIAIMTGGDARAILPLLRSTPRYEADLVLQGIAIMAGDEQ